MPFPPQGLEVTWEQLKKVVYRPRPEVVGSLTHASLNGVQCLLVSGKYAYVHSWGAGEPLGIVSVVDISMPGSPELLGSVSSNLLRASPHNMALSGKYLLTCGSNAAPAPVDSALAIVDISNPAAPSLVTTLYDNVNLEDNHAVQVNKGIAWCNCPDGNRITAVDISNPSSPYVLGTLQDAVALAQCLGFQIRGDYAYIGGSGGGSNRVTVVDISNPSAISVTGSVQDNVQLNAVENLKLRGQYAYVAVRAGNRLTVVDIGNPAAPSVVGTVQSNAYLDGAHNVALIGDFAVVAAIDCSYLTIVDVSNPALPQIVERVTHAQLDGALHVDILGGHAIVGANRGDAIVVVRLFEVEHTAMTVGHIEADSIIVQELRAEGVVAADTGLIPSPSKLVMKPVPDLALSLVNQSNVVWTNLNLSAYIPEGAIAVILRLAFNDSGSAAAEADFIVRYNATYELQRVGGKACHINSAWGSASGLMLLPPSRVVQYAIYATGAGTAAFRVYVVGYFMPC